MQINRLFEMVYLLLSRKTITAQELADRFEVSKRTILRDIDTLCQAGVPVYTVQGRGGGISILDQYVLNKAALSDEEQDQILLALQSLASTRHLEAGTVLSKLRTLFGKEDESWIEVDFSRWGSEGADQVKFSDLRDAVLKKQAVAFRYVGASGTCTGRTVYPLKLVFKSSAWYLRAYCLSREDYRTFKISRILSLQVLPDTFADVALPVPSAETGPEGCAPFTHLELRFSPEVAHRVYDEFDESAVSIQGDGSFLVTADMPEDDWLYGYLLSFGAAVQVRQPECVAQGLALRAKKIELLYRSPL